MARFRREYSGRITEMDQFDVLCFKGAGFKVIAYLGMLQALEDRFETATGKQWNDHLQTHMVGFCGASAGAITALALCLGLKCADCRQAMKPILENASNIVPQPDIAALCEHYGLDRGNVLRGIICDLLHRGGVSSDVTFAALHSLTRRQFYCSGTNLTTAKTQIFGHETTPDVRVQDAVFISACVPILFSPMRLGDDLYVDGALTCNLVDVFDMKRCAVCNVPEPSSGPVSSWSEYVRSILRLSLNAQTQREDDLCASAAVRVTAQMPSRLRDIGNMDMSIDSERFAEIERCGYVAMVERLFAWWNEAMRAMCEVICVIARIRDGSTVVCLHDDVAPPSPKHD